VAGGRAAGLREAGIAPHSQRRRENRFLVVLVGGARGVVGAEPVARAGQNPPPHPAALPAKPQKIESLSPFGGEAAAKPPDCLGMKAHSRPDYGYLVNGTLALPPQALLASVAKTCLATL